MKERERIELLDGMDAAFKSGVVAEASSEQLQKWLVGLCTGSIPNHMVHPREIVRGITINHIQMARTICHLEETIERLEADNQNTQKNVVKLTRVTIALAVVAIIFGILQTVATIIGLFK